MILKRASLVTRVVFAAVAFGLVFTVPNSGFFALPAANAQAIGQRVVFGYVSDTDSTPVAGATVFLKNLKTKAIRSFTSVQDGKFRFGQVAMTDEHELWAEKNGKKSAVKTVSSWDTRKEFEVELKLK